jgi:hypothetical protein
MGRGSLCGPASFLDGFQPSDDAWIWIINLVVLERLAPGERWELLFRMVGWIHLEGLIDIVVLGLISGYCCVCRGSSSVWFSYESRCEDAIQK